MSILRLFNKIKGILNPSKNLLQPRRDIITFKEFCELTHRERMDLFYKSQAEMFNKMDDTFLMNMFLTKDIKSIREEWEANPLCNSKEKQPPKCYDFGAIIQRELKISRSTRDYEDDD